MADALRVSAATLVEAGIKDGQDLKNAAAYVNYALLGHRWRRCMVNIWSGFVGSGRSMILRMLWDSQADGKSNMSDSEVIFPMMWAEIVCWHYRWAS